MFTQLTARFTRAIMAIGLFCLITLSIDYGQAFAMGGGMMGMGGGRSDTSVASVNPAQSEKLLAYIKKQNLACLQCHTVSHSAFGPSFASIATNYAKQSDAAQVLSQHIAHGIGRMPPGLATESQAKQIAHLILDLYGPQSTKSHGANY